MAFINGYKYTTESEAKAAQKACNDYYGIPKTPEDVTKNWVEYQFAEFNQPQFWYIYFDESLLPILGKPIKLEIITPPFPPVA
jgi:hypothetical protein